MRKRCGAIVFTASTAGLVGASVGRVHSAAGFGVVNMGKSLALRYAEEKVRVNMVCPGPIDTPMFPTFLDPNPNAELAAAAPARTVATIPLACRGQALEVAHAALFLASDEASFVTTRRCQSMAASPHAVLPRP